jgi:hypothetical protein
MAGSQDRGKTPQFAFTEAAGKTVASIRYQEHEDWQALEVQFTDGTLFSFELLPRVALQVRYLEQRHRESEVIRDYGVIPKATD